MSVLLTAIGVNTINKVISYNELTEQIERINISTLKISSYIQEFADRGFKQRDFLVDNNSIWIKAYKDEFDQLKNELNVLTNHKFFKTKARVRSYDSLVVLLNLSDQHVKSLKNLYSERGFKDYGVEGKLRSAIHDVEDANFSYDRATLLMLRRHEKDFFLRKDLKYREKFNAVIDQFKTQIDRIYSESEQTKSLIIENIDTYKNRFNYIVALEEKIGLDNKSGKVGEINSTFEMIENSLNFLTKLIKEKNQKTANRSMVLLLVLLIFQVIFGVVLVILYANVLTKAIKEIKSALVGLSHGAFPKQMVVRTKDEISEAKLALNQLVDRIKAAVKFSTDLGKGNLNINYDEKYNNDVLSSAIIKMKDQLIEADEKQTAINWGNEGMAKFSEILKNETDDLLKLGDDIIGQMVKYLDANQGALYIVKEDELERISTYAYHKKKYVDHKVKIGQGLVGQCVLEKSPIHMTDIPEDFISITSGLGNATAKSILIVPLMVRENVMGVIELASFKPFSNQKISFIKRVSENIANILSNKQIAENTKLLLAEAQQKAEELKSQEEELRQNSEELQATQEEMQRQKKEMESYISDLEVRLNKKQKQLNQIITQLQEVEKAKELEYKI